VPITNGNGILVLKISWDSITCDVNHVFIDVLKILVGKPTRWQTSFHSCMLFVDFFVQMMVFCKVVWAYFKFTSIMPTQTLVSFMENCAALDMPCPKQDPMKGKTNFKIEQLTIEVKVIIRDARLLPSSLT
jgi:hypothetical protein